MLHNLCNISDVHNGVLKWQTNGKYWHSMVKRNFCPIPWELDFDFFAQFLKVRERHHICTITNHGDIGTKSCEVFLKDVKSWPRNVHLPKRPPVNFFCLVPRKLILHTSFWFKVLPLSLMVSFQMVSISNLNYSDSTLIHWAQRS